MTSKQYQEHIRSLQEEEFGDIFTGYPHKNQIREGVVPRKLGSQAWSYFAPSWFFNPLSPFMTEEDVKGLQSGKTILSVGCGPAYLERLLVAKLGISLDQITLADISRANIPPEFRFHELDMYEPWQNVGKFDYVIFPESVFSKEDGEDYRVQEPFYEEGEEIRCTIPGIERDLSELISLALPHLNSFGKMAMSHITPCFYNGDLKKHVEQRYGVQFEQKGSVIMIQK